MQCQQFMEGAADWMEGHWSSEAQAHRSACAQCGALLADLEAIQHAAPLLAEPFAEPPERVWLSVRAQLQAEGILRTQRSWLDRLKDSFTLAPRPVMAGAYAALFAAGVALFFATSHHPSNNPLAQLATRNSASPLASTPTAAPPDSVYSAQLANVELNTMGSVRAQDPAIADSYRQNLAIVDNFIAVCEKRVQQDPQNSVAREYLLNAYQQKADLLAAMVDRGTLGD
ncbi:MAG: hypothetical protein GZ088_01255 [Acidipila sp.]|nr:hypothetical protein [Acidipila sp.]